MKIDELDLEKSMNLLRSLPCLKNSALEGRLFFVDFIYLFDCFIIDISLLFLLSFMMMMIIIIIIMIIIIIIIIIIMIITITIMIMIIIQQSNK